MQSHTSSDTLRGDLLSEHSLALGGDEITSSKLCTDYTRRTEGARMEVRGKPCTLLDRLTMA